MGRGSLCLVLGQNAGKLASETLPHHPATCQSFPAIASISCSPDPSRHPPILSGHGQVGRTAAC